MSFSVFKLSKLSKLPNSNSFTVYLVTGESNGLIGNRLKAKLQLSKAGRWLHRGRGLITIGTQTAAVKGVADPANQALDKALQALDRAFSGFASC